MSRQTTQRTKQKSTKVLARVMKQNSRTLYGFSLPHRVAYPMMFSEEFTEDNPTGDQRPINKTHLTKYISNIQYKEAFRPQSLVVNVVSETAKLIPVDIPESAEEHVLIDFGTQPRCLRVVEGNHGREAVEEAGSPWSDEWDHNLVALFNATDAECQTLNGVINVNPKKQDKSINHYLDWKNGILDEDRLMVGQIFDRLNSDPDSALYRRVRCCHNQQPAEDDDGVVKSLGFCDYLDRFAEKRSTEKLGGFSTVPEVFRSVFVGKKVTKSVYGFVKAYYNTWRDEFWSEWHDRKAYCISENLGPRALTRAFQLFVLKFLRSNLEFTPENMKQLVSKTAAKIRKDAATSKMWLTHDATARDKHRLRGFGPERRMIRQIQTKLSIRFPKKSKGSG